MVASRYENLSKAIIESAQAVGMEIVKVPRRKSKNKPKNKPWSKNDLNCKNLKNELKSALRDYYVSSNFSDDNKISFLEYKKRYRNILDSSKKQYAQYAQKLLLKSEKPI